MALASPTPLGTGTVDLAGGTLQFTGTRGFYGAYYNVANDGNVPNFSGLTPVGTRFDATIDFPDDGNGFEPGISGLDASNSGAVWTGLLNIATGGFYNFQIISDDGSLVYVDGVQVVNDNGSHPMQTASGGLDLASGYHLVTVQYAQGGGGAGVVAQYAGADTRGAMIDLGSLSGTVTAGGATNLPNALSVTANSSIQLSDCGGTVSLASLAIGGQTLHVVGSGTLAVSGAVALAGGGSGTFDVSNNATLALDGVVSGDGDLTKTGAGNMVLAAANTYSGTTNVTSGSLQALAAVGAGGVNSLPGNVSLTSATLRLSPSFGPGTPGFFASYYNVTNDGNVPDFTGLTPVATRVDATIDFPNDNNGFEPGVSGLNATDSGAVWAGLLNIATGGFYNFQTTSDDGSLLYVDGTQVVNDDGPHAMQSAIGSIELAPGRHLVTIEYAQAGGGAGIIAQYSGADTGNAMIDLGGLAGTVSNPGGNPAAATMSLANDLSISGSSSIDLDLNAAFSGTLSAADGSQLTLATEPTADYGVEQAMYTQAGAVTLAGSLVVNTATGDASISAPVGETLPGVGSLLKDGAGTLTLSAASTYGGGTALDAGIVDFAALDNLGGGAITFDGGTLRYAAGNTADISGRGVTFDARGATIDVGANNVTFTQPIGNGGSGGLTMVGSGTLTLSGANTYAGDTMVTAGTLQLDASGGPALAGNLVVTGGIAQMLQSGQLAPHANLVVSGGTFDLGPNAVTVGGVQLVGGSIVGTGVLTSSTVFQLQAGTVSAALDGPVGLAKTGSGTLVLIGDDTCAGDFTISAGTLQLGDGTASSGSIGGNIINNGTLVFANPTDQTYSGAISGSGSVIMAGAGTLTLDGQSTYAGQTVIAGGTVVLGSDNALPPSTVVQIGDPALGCGAGPCGSQSSAGRALHGRGGRRDQPALGRGHQQQPCSRYVDDRQLGRLRFFGDVHWGPVAGQVRRGEVDGRRQQHQLGRRVGLRRDPGDRRQLHRQRAYGCGFRQPPPFRRRRPEVLDR